MKNILSLMPHETPEAEKWVNNAITDIRRDLQRCETAGVPYLQLMLDIGKLIQRLGYAVTCENHPEHSPERRR